MKSFKLMLFALMGSLFIPNKTFSQYIYTSDNAIKLSGTIVDENGAPVNGATVQLWRWITARKAVTDAEGKWTIEETPAGINAPSNKGFSLARTDRGGNLNFTLDKAGRVTIEVLAISGQTRKVLMDGFLQPGKYSEELNVPSVGMFLLRISMDGTSSFFHMINLGSQNPLLVPVSEKAALQKQPLRKTAVGGIDMLKASYPGKMSAQWEITSLTAGDQGVKQLGPYAEWDVIKDGAFLPTALWMGGDEVIFHTKESWSCPADAGFCLMATWKPKGGFQGAGFVQFGDYSQADTVIVPEGANKIKLFAKAHNADGGFLKIVGPSGDEEVIELTTAFKEYTLDISKPNYSPTLQPMGWGIDAAMNGAREEVTFELYGARFIYEP